MTTATRPRVFPHYAMGQQFKEPLSVEGAFGAAGLRWTTNAYPVYTDLISPTVPDATVRTQAEDHWAIVREDNNTILGVVGNRYTIVDNEEVEETLDGIKLPVVAAGERKGGAKCFVLFKVDEFKVGGDNFFAYIDAHWSHDGSSPINISFKVHRLICTNGMNRLIGKPNIIKVRHTASASSKMAMAAQVLTQAHEWQELFIRETEFLQSYQLTRGAVSEIVAKLLPPPKKENPRALGRVKAKRELIWSNFLHDQDPFGDGPSLWGLVQAVNEYEFWQAPVRGGEKARAESQLQRLEMDRFPLTHKLLALADAEAGYDDYWAANVVAPV